MPTFDYQVVFFCAESTAVVRAGAHSHSALYLPALATAYSWGVVDHKFKTTGPGRSRSASRTNLGAGVYYHEDLGFFGHSVINGTTNNTEESIIANHGTNWNAAHVHGGAYPHNCRGAVDDFLSIFVDPATAQVQINALAVYFKQAG